MGIFFELHQDLPREGPGDNPSTRKALALLVDLPPRPLILDIGCGPGMQTVELARCTNGKIIAIDTHQPFLEKLKQRAQAEGLSDKITTINMSMFALDFEAKSFDAIWSEGAIYIMGFEQGLRACQPLLKPGGYVAVSEICWLRPQPPSEVQTFWAANYPGMEPSKRTWKSSGLLATVKSGILCCLPPHGGKATIHPRRHGLPCCGPSIETMSKLFSCWTNRNLR